MAPAKFDTSLHLPVVFKFLPILGAFFLFVCFLVQTFLPHERTDFIEWKTNQQALELSKKSQHPILYYFTSELSTECHALSDEIFRDTQLSKWINDSFVPVRLVEVRLEESANPPEVTKLQKKYHIDKFPTIIITNLKVVEYKKQVGYPGKDKTKKFLEDTFSWMATEISPYVVNYLKLDDAIVASRAAQKPLLLVFWDERGDMARYSYLANSELVQLIRTKFVVAEITQPISQEQAKSPAAKELITKLGMHRTPAMVIVPVDGSMPHFQIGPSYTTDNREFLEKYLRLASDKAIKASKTTEATSLK